MQQHFPNEFLNVLLYNAHLSCAIILMKWARVCSVEESQLPLSPLGRDGIMTSSSHLLYSHSRLLCRGESLLNCVSKTTLEVQKKGQPPSQISVKNWIQKRFINDLFICEFSGRADMLLLGLVFIISFFSYEKDPLHPLADRI